MMKEIKVEGSAIGGPVYQKVDWVDRSDRTPLIIKLSIMLEMAPQ